MPLEDFLPEPTPYSVTVTPPPPRPVLAPEPPLSGHAPRVQEADSAPANTAFPSAAVGLAELKSAGVRVDWFESIAIIQDLCLGLIESDGPVPATLDAVFIDSSGRVTTALRASAAVAAPVARLGELLSAIFAHDFMATRLNDTVVAKAKAVPAVYGSVDEFSQVLAYYQRPNRQQLIQAVYERWQQPSSAEAVSSAQVSVLADPQEEQKESPEPTEKRRLRAMWIGVAAGVLATAAVVVLVMWRPGLRSLGPTAPLPSAGSILAAPGAAINAVASRIGAVLNPPAAQPKAAADSAAAKTSLPTRRPHASTSARRTASKPAALPTPTLVRPSSAAIDPSAGSPSLQPPAVGDAPDSPDAAIYTSSDVDVVAPVVIYPQKLIAATGTSGENAPAIEIVVNEQGLIESVKATSARTIGEYMMVTSNLSVVKSWRFKPAMKNGRPVKYKTAVSVTRG